MTLRIEKGIEVKRAGGVGFILGNTPENGFDLPADPHLLPATAVSSEDVTKIRNYIKSTKKPMATIIPGRTVLHAKPAPFMASFISRGPNTIDPNILKVIPVIIFFFSYWAFSPCLSNLLRLLTSGIPHTQQPDITGPGLNILAAWSEGSSPTRSELDPRVVKYNIFSGTSMSCPHVAAAVALLKAIHPNWSSAAIRSALMTTGIVKQHS